MAGAAFLAGGLIFLGPWKSSSERRPGPVEAGVTAEKAAVPAEAAISGPRAALVSPQVLRRHGAKGWSRSEESLYSAWIEALFAEADERSSWKALHEVMRDPARNILHNHLGLGEDEASGPNALVMTPDCADNPYFLRAYFAWKLGLPFGFHETSWGSLETAPRGLRFRTEGLSAFFSALRDPGPTEIAGKQRLQGEAQSEEKRLAADIDKEERLSRTRVDLVNGIIMKKTFLWTSLFSELEKALPGSSYITALSPGFTSEGAVALRLRVTSRSLDDLLALIDNLSAQGFKGIQVFGESRNEDGRLITEISLTYEHSL